MLSTWGKGELWFTCGLCELNRPISCLYDPADNTCEYCDAEINGRLVSTAQQHLWCIHGRHEVLGRLFNDGGEDSRCRPCHNPTYSSDEFLRLRPRFKGNAGLKTWVGGKILGEGGFGKAAVFVQLDSANRIADRIVIKVIFGRPSWFLGDFDEIAASHKWTLRTRPRPIEPREAHVQGLLLGKPNIVACRGSRVDEWENRYWVLSDYCPFGDLGSLIQKYQQEGYE